MLDAKVWWPLFPLLLLLVVVCLTWALVFVIKRPVGAQARWLQTGAFGCYILAAVSAIASERGAVSAHLHRPFSLAAQVCLVLALVHHRRSAHTTLRWLNGAAWAGILADAALHVLMVRSR